MDRNWGNLQIADFSFQFVIDDPAMLPAFPYPLSSETYRPNQPANGFMPDGFIPTLIG
jgi:hypothetical protein